MNGLHYCFVDEGIVFLYDIGTNCIMEISEKLYECLLRYKNKHVLGTDERQIVKRFLENGFLKEEPFENLDKKEYEIGYLTFAPMYGCNFRCKYCFGQYGNAYKGKQRLFDEAGVASALDFFFYKAFPHALRYRLDFVSGGEPLLGIDIIKKTVSLINEFQKKSKKQVSVWLCTNASLLTDEIIEFFSDNNISIGVSLDGPRELNDLYRIDVEGKGTYDRIVQGISIVHNNSNITNKTKDLWGLCTITNENCDFVAIMDEFKNLGFRKLQMRLIRSTGSYDVSKIISEYKKLFEFFLKEYQEGKTDSIKMILNDNDQFGKVFKRILLGATLTRRCNAGLNKITICPDGTIYPCDSLVGTEDCVLGNIYNGDMDRNFSDLRTLDKINKCSTCDINFLCGGDCYYNSLLKNGDQFKPDDEFCTIQRFLIQKAIVLRYRMERENADMLDSIIKEVRIKDAYSRIIG